MQMMIIVARCLVLLLVTENLFVDRFCAPLMIVIDLSAFLMMNYLMSMEC